MLKDSDFLKHYAAGKLVLESMDILGVPDGTPARRKADDASLLAYQSLSEEARKVAHDFYIGLTEVILRFENDLASLKKV